MTEGTLWLVHIPLFLATLGILLKIDDDLYSGANDLAYWFLGALVAGAMVSAGCILALDPGPPRAHPAAWIVGGAALAVTIALSILSRCWIVIFLWALLFVLFWVWSVVLSGLFSPDRSVSLVGWIVIGVQSLVLLAVYTLVAAKISVDS
jgi:hypothetical protein